MDYDTLITEVQELISDPSTRIIDKIPDFINEALQEAAGRVLLPNLKRVATIATNTSQAWVTLPSGSSGKVTAIKNASSTGDIIDLIHGSVEDLLLGNIGELDTNSGSIVQAVVEGNILWYQKVPSSIQTLIFVHYVNPVDLSSPNDIPVDIPVFLRRKILVHGAAMIAYREIEEDVEDVKVETRENTLLFERGILDLKSWVDTRSNHARKGGNYYSV